MESFILDWLSLALRWLHLITGIAWIGASFYFIWLDNSLTSPPAWKKEKGISGDLWAFHGGGIYEVGKYTLAPKEMPSTLHWFKWEAYSTWISGSLLLIAIYYFRAELYLIGQDKWLHTPSLSILGSIVFLVSGLLVYETLLKVLAKSRTQIFASLLSAYLAFCCWLAVQLFSDRAAFLHVGALMATIMAANVFLGIIPAQKAFIKAIEAGDEPSKERMLGAKNRSVHNNYFTLPVLFCMISNHYAFVYGHSYNWLILISILAIAAYARHFFNLRHKGIIKPQILIFSLVALMLIMSLMYIIQLKDQARQAEVINKDETIPEATLVKLAKKHCSGCHAKQPTTPGFSAAPAGIVLESNVDFIRSKEKVVVAVNNKYMPLGNMTGMSEKERTLFLNLLAELD